MGSDKCLNAQVLRNDFHVVETHEMKELKKTWLKAIQLFICYIEYMFKISQKLETVWEMHLLLSPLETHHRENWEQQQKQPRLVCPFPAYTARGLWVHASTTGEGECNLSRPHLVGLLPQLLHYTLTKSKWLWPCLSCETLELVPESVRWQVLQALSTVTAASPGESLK